MRHQRYPAGEKMSSLDGSIKRQGPGDVEQTIIRADHLRARQRLGDEESEERNCDVGPERAQTDHSVSGGCIQVF